MPFRHESPQKVARLIYDIGDLEQLGADGQTLAFGRFSGDVYADFVFFNDKTDCAPPFQEGICIPHR